MAVSRRAMGMNARNFLYIRKYNSPSAKRLADDKLESKKILLENNVATTAMLAAFYDRDEIRSFNWASLPKEGFVIKPARGYGGAGILVMKSWNGDHGVSVVGQEYTVAQLESHILDVLDGAFSLQFLPDKAYIEERVVVHPFFKKLSPIGIPDIRIVVFNTIPLMSMMRLPTEESGGKANLHLGALGIGIDIRTGITTYAVYKGRNIEQIPGTKTKIRGIKIPYWDDLLLLAAKTQSIIKLGYAGVDIVLDAKKGPLILELNARPGLAIQIANLRSLRTRLERVENMVVTSPERGVEVGKSLFAEPFSDRVTTSPKVLTLIQPIVLRNQNRVLPLKAKLDTGAYRTSVDYKVVDELGLEKNNEKVYVKSASGEKYRPTVNVSFELAGKKIKTVASIADRQTLQYPMIIGRRDLGGFLINPSYTGDEDDKEESDTEE